MGTKSWIFVIFLQLCFHQRVEVVSSLKLRTYKLCVSELLLPLCKQMINDVSSPNARIQCYPANDKIDCLEKMSKNEADFLVIEPEDIFVAHLMPHDFRVFSDVRGKLDEEFRYKSVAVVRNSAGIKSLDDLKGKKSCHTGYGRNAGWKIPFSHLLDYGDLTRHCREVDGLAIEKDMAALSSFFGSACAPGKWAPEDAHDAQLKRKYSKLCEMCEKPRKCLDSDKYAGYHGAVACLVENNGDIAWTKLSAVYEYFRLPPPGENLNSRPFLSSVNDFSFLCPDGSAMPLTSPNPCSFAARPWKAYLSSGGLSPGEIQDLQGQLSLYWDTAMSEANPQPWLEGILEYTRTDKAHHHWPTLSPTEYLDKGNYTVTIEKPSCPTQRDIRLCTRDPLEFKKCTHLFLAARSRRILPLFDCVEGSGARDCVDKIKNGRADIISLSPKESFKYGVWNNPDFSPITTELKWIDLEEPEPYSFTVALVDSNSGITQMRDLQGKRSCHGSISSYSGWNNPLNMLEQSGVMSRGSNEEGHSCQAIGRLSSLFSKGSCIPGASDPSLIELPENLQKSYCRQCTGDTLNGISTHETLCLNDENEQFWGDEGSFRCLKNGDGDVAFMDLNAIFHFTEPNQTEESVELLSTTYKLLCPQGNSTMDLTEFRACNWGKSPSNKVWTTKGSNKKDKIFQEEIKMTLFKVANAFAPSPKSPLQIAFRLFGHYEGVPNVIFQHNSVGFADEGTMKEENQRTDALLKKYDTCKMGDYSSGNVISQKNSHLLLVFAPIYFYIKYTN